MTVTPTALGRRVRTTHPAAVRWVPRTPCGSYDQTSTTARTSSSVNSCATGDGVECPLSAGPGGAGTADDAATGPGRATAPGCAMASGCATGAPVGSPGS